MKILVTGASGFIGKNLVAKLKTLNIEEIYEYDIHSIDKDLDRYTKDCDFVFHLAGVNRPNNDTEFLKGNTQLTEKILDKLEKNSNKCPIMISSSVHAIKGNKYGESKKAAEEILINYSKKNKVKIFIYRFPNVFGKWCKPNYNSVIATFCHSIANNLDIHVNDPETELELLYIDDLINEMIHALEGFENRDGYFCHGYTTHKIKLSRIVELLNSYHKSRSSFEVPFVSTEFSKKLYSTYLSYVDPKELSYDLIMHTDDRGSFTEFLKSNLNGQISINISKPGIVKGNHWHNTKNEKFLVISGKAVIRLRNINETKVIEYYVSDRKLEVIDIPPGYTHNIENIGTDDMVTVIWANEIYDKQSPDTIYEEV